MAQLELKGLQIARKAKGLTQVQLARHLEVSQCSIATAESGEKPISLAKVVRASEILGVSIDYIIRGV